MRTTASSYGQSCSFDGTLKTLKEAKQSLACFHCSLPPMIVTAKLKTTLRSDFFAKVAFVCVSEFLFTHNARRQPSGSNDWNK